MNINDRRRVSALIESEFASKLSAISTEITEEQIEAESEAILKQSRLQQKVERLQKLMEQGAVLRKELATSLSALRAKSPKRTKRRFKDCECHDDYEDLLRKFAQERIESRRVDAEQARSSLFKQKRSLLARLEIARSVEDLEKVIKSAGLVS